MKKNLRIFLALALGFITVVSTAQDWDGNARTRVDMGGDNDKFVSEKFVTVLKYLSDTLPEMIKLNLLDYNGENPKNLSLTFTGIIDAADYESDVILSDFKYRLEKHDLFKRVKITSKKPGHENTLSFQMSIAL